VHISHITGIPTAEVTPFFSKLEQEGKISPVKVGRKSCYIHSSKTELLDKCADQDSEEVHLISPMDILVRDQTWLKTFFDYSYTFEYFKKKGMKWPLSILVGNRFVGYFDCKMEWRTKRFIIKEKNTLILGTLLLPRGLSLCHNSFNNTSGNPSKPVNCIFYN